MPSMNAVINGHNKKVLSEISNQNERSCNCRNPELCPVDGKCLTPGVMYQATVNSDLPRYEARIYKGITNRQFKERRKEHIKTFNNQRLRKDSKLSEEVWRIKDAGGTPQVTWTILDKCKAYTPQAKRCALCLTEKLAIAEHEGSDMLNKRSEIVAKCRHTLKYELAQKDTKD